MDRAGAGGRGDAGRQWSRRDAGSLGSLGLASERIAHAGAPQAADEVGQELVAHRARADLVEATGRVLEPHVAGRLGCLHEGHPADQVVGERFGVLRILVGVRLPHVRDQSSDRRVGADPIRQSLHHRGDGLLGLGAGLEQGFQGGRGRHVVGRRHLVGRGRRRVVPGGRSDFLCSVGGSGRRDGVVPRAHRHAHGAFGVGRRGQVGRGRFVALCAFLTSRRGCLVAPIRAAGQCSHPYGRAGAGCRPLCSGSKGTRGQTLLGVRALDRPVLDDLPGAFLGGFLPRLAQRLAHDPLADASHQTLRTEPHPERTGGGAQRRGHQRGFPDRPVGDRLASLVVGLAFGARLDVFEGILQGRLRHRHDLVVGAAGRVACGQQGIGHDTQGIPCCHTGTASGSGHGGDQCRRAGAQRLKCLVDRLSSEVGQTLHHLVPPRDVLLAPVFLGQLLGFVLLLLQLVAGLGREVLALDALGVGRRPVGQRVHPQHARSAPDGRGQPVGRHVEQVGVERTAPAFAGLGLGLLPGELGHGVSLLRLRGARRLHPGRREEGLGVLLLQILLVRSER